MAFFDVLQDATISVQNRPLILQSRKFGEFTLDTTESSTNIGHSYLAMQAQGALLVLKVIAAKPDCCPRTFYTHITTHFTAGTSPELIKMTDIHLRMAVAKLIVDKIDFTQTPHKSNLLWMVHNVSDRDTVDEFYTELGFSRVVQAGNKHIVYYYASPDDDDDGDYNAVYDPQPFQPEHAGDPNLVLATQ